MQIGTKKGKLYLVGAGPGDPELLTLKAARILSECDVILYDRLVSKDILGRARPDAELIYVGKHEGEQDTQARISDLIQTHALAGKTVVRLKGGDPLVFGRGAEEWAVAVEQGIDVELIPGVSSAIAVPGLAGIPLTYRGVAQSFAVITAHCHEGRTEEWSKYAGVDTIVVLMGVRNREFIAHSLIAAGRSRNQPVAFVERGTMPDEVIIESTLGAMASGQVNVQSPAVLVIGEVVRVRERLTAPSAPRQPLESAERV
ncbi:MAG TPA: uroporphyrinogen-III C-methyltransferase [Bryobacteraceae bacterium]